MKDFLKKLEHFSPNDEFKKGCIDRLSNIKPYLCSKLDQLYNTTANERYISAYNNIVHADKLKQRKKESILIDLMNKGELSHDQYQYLLAEDTPIEEIEKLAKDIENDIPK